MAFDTIIIGGGISALACGIRLQQQGKRTAVLKSGQGTMYFFSGAFGLLSRMPDGSFVEDPFKAMENLPDTHPYSKIGAADFRSYAMQMPAFFRECGIDVNDCSGRNGWRFLASGAVKPAWMSLDDLDLFEDRGCKPGEKALIVNLNGFMDFFPDFIEHSLSGRGVECRKETMVFQPAEELRLSSNVMRTLNVSKLFDNEDTLDAFISELKGLLRDEDLVILPMFFGSKDSIPLDRIREQIPVKVMFFNTLTPSVCGIRTMGQLREAYEALGGTLIMSPVRSAELSEGRIVSIATDSEENPVMTADNYVLATGSFISKGLVSDSSSVKEPLLGLDVDFPESRADWYDEDSTASQNYIAAGVRTDRSFRPSIEGRTLDNLYAIGSVLSGAHSSYEGSGAGVAVLTAFKVADILK